VCLFPRPLHASHTVLSTRGYITDAMVAAILSKTRGHITHAPMVAVLTSHTHDLFAPPILCVQGSAC